jgi:hypothetical protein
MTEKPEKQARYEYLDFIEKFNKANDKNDLSEEELITLLKTARNILAR